MDEPVCPGRQHQPDEDQWDARQGRQDDAGDADEDKNDR